MPDKPDVDLARARRVLGEPFPQGGIGEKVIARLAAEFRAVRLEEHKMICARCALADAGEAISERLGCERRAQLEAK